MMNEENVIRSAVEFVQKISELRKTSVIFREASLSSLTFFRGQANHEWGLSPRLYREGLFKKERALISEFIRVAPEEFKNMTQFDILVKMQHYGLPTRLLDTTLNPLVALFFACYEASYKDTPGNVFIFRSLPVFRPEMSVIKNVMKFVFEYSGTHYNVENFLKDIFGSKTLTDLKTNQNELKDQLGFSTIPFHAVIPNLNNPRIVNQEGAFFLFGMEVQKNIRPNSKNHPNESFEFMPFQIIAPEDLKRFFGNPITFLIPSESKESILEDLESLGVSKNKMFPELEYQADYITQQIKKDIERSGPISTFKSENYSKPIKCNFKAEE